jgi:hypothetical protein
MGKKSKKKTIASTRKIEATEELGAQIKPQKEKKKLIGKLFGKKPHTAKPAPAAPVEHPKAEPEKIETHIAKPKKEKRRLSPIQKQKIKGGFLILIGLFALSFIGYFLFGKFFRPQYLAELLPAQETVAVLEINVDGSSSQPRLFYELMKKYPVYQQEGLIKLLHLIIPVDYKKEIEPWLGRHAGLALLHYESGFQPIIFIESRDHNLTLQSLKNATLSQAKDEVVSSDYKGYKVYTFSMSHSFEFTFINNYLVIANEDKTLNKLIDLFASQQTRLNDDPEYRKVANNLPQGGLAAGYVNYQKLFEAMASDPKFTAQKGQDYLALKPFLNLFTAEGISVFAEKNRFVAQTFTSINKKVLGKDNFLTYNEKYEGKLLSLANENPILFAGGHDLTKELNRIKDIFKSSTNTSSVIFEGLLEAQKEKYFGKDIKLDEDIYPLFTGEYLLTVDNNLEEPDLTLILELKDKNNDVIRLEKLIGEFVKTSGIFTPKIQNVTLPDGTSGQEIVASPEKIDRFDEKYNETAITSLKIGETGWFIYMAYLDDKVVFCTDKDTIKKIINRSQGKVTTNLTTEKYFIDNVRQFIRSADQVYGLKIGALIQASGLNENPAIGAYLLPFTDLSVAKNFFEDGISEVISIQVI